MGGLKLSRTLSIICTLYILIFQSSQAAPMVVYWNPNGNFRASLFSICDTKKYQIVNIPFLSTFGNGRTPSLNLTGYCGGPNDKNRCDILYSQIRICQAMGVKVLLSIGGTEEEEQNYSLSSADEAINLAIFIANNFFNGESNSRLFGDVVLDGVDFHVDFGKGQFWGELALQLRRFGRFIISGAPLCSNTVAFSNAANVNGLFDFVWVRFDNNPSCMFQDNNVDNLLTSWNQWSAISSGMFFFLGLPASPDAVSGGGFIPVDTLVSNVILSVKFASNYGGVVLWNSHFDATYGDDIKNDI